MECLWKCRSRDRGAIFRRDKQTAPRRLRGGLWASWTARPQTTPPGPHGVHAVTPLNISQSELHLHLKIALNNHGEDIKSHLPPDKHTGAQNGVKMI